MDDCAKYYFWLWLLTPVVLVPIIYAAGKELTWGVSFPWVITGVLFLGQWISDRSQRRRNSSPSN